MSSVTLYNALIQLGLDPETAERAVEEIANTKDVATKTDLLKLETDIKADLTAGLLKLEIKLTNKMYGLGAAMVAIIIAAVGLMIKFL